MGGKVSDKILKANYMTMHVKAHKGNYFRFYYMFYMIMQGCYWWGDGGTSRPDLQGLSERIIFF